MPDEPTSNDTILNIRIDSNTQEMVDTIKTDFNLRSISEAIRLLIKKGYDQHIKEQALMSNFIN